jgi:hypothetical protein
MWFLEAHRGYDDDLRRESRVSPDSDEPAITGQHHPAPRPARTRTNKHQSVPHGLGGTTRSALLMRFGLTARPRFESRNLPSDQHVRA